MPGQLRVIYVARSLPWQRSIARPCWRRAVGTLAVVVLTTACMVVGHGAGATFAPAAQMWARLAGARARRHGISGHCARSSCSQPHACRIRRSALPEAPWLDTFLADIPGRVEALGPLGPVYFYGTFVLSSCLLLPVTPLMLSAGYLFGLPLGACVSLLAVCTSASLCFLLARTLLRGQVEAAVASDQRLTQLNSAVRRGGLKVMLLLRLSPLLPFSASNYALGLSGVGLGDFVLGTALGYAPWTLAAAYATSSARGLWEEGAETPWYVYAAGAALTAALVKFAADIVELAVAEAAEDAAPTTGLSAGERPQPPQ
mmetsp:Transcript_82789/g.256950  ORF Transcript_82789/g.256950 Transcript_82789/m.256950 type:complete len:315 (+) Transcript_82789:45-989(+)